jgi:tetrahydromethanopterin S-methyltransferase subunit B
MGVEPNFIVQVLSTPTLFLTHDARSNVRVHIADMFVCALRRDVMMVSIDRLFAPPVHLSLILRNISHSPQPSTSSTSSDPGRTGKDRSLRLASGRTALQ